VKFESSASYTWRPKNLIPPKILAEPSFRRLERRDYPRSLNEARLTALAIAIYLAGLKLLPATGFRLLVLDDILIGLDMMNRVKILDLIHEHFADWQILIFTYSKAWFERLREGIQEKGEFPGWGAPWESVTLWEEWRDGENSPRIVAEGSGDLLEMADRHLQTKDYTAAAVYARKALERLCHRICAKASLFVLHVEFPNERKVEHFLNALTPRLRELVDNARRAQALQLLSRLEQARAFVLNRNAHFDLEEEDTLSAEVGTAIEVMKDLTTFLTAQSWKKANFESGRTLTSLEQMNAEISAARKAAAKGAINQARLSLANAHNAFWRVFGLKLGCSCQSANSRQARKFGNKLRFKIA
jgi:HEPN domain-containing protein